MEPSFFISVRKSWQRFFLWDQPRLAGRIYWWQQEGRHRLLKLESWRKQTGLGVMRRAFGSLRPSWRQLHFGTQYVLWQHPGFPASSGAGGHASSSLSLASSWDPPASLLGAKPPATVENLGPGERHKQTCEMGRSPRTHPTGEPSLCPEHLKPFLTRIKVTLPGPFLPCNWVIVHLAALENPTGFQ